MNSNDDRADDNARRARAVIAHHCTGSLSDDFPGLGDIKPDTFKAICKDFVKLFDDAVAQGVAPGPKSKDIAARARKLLGTGGQKP